MMKRAFKGCAIISGLIEKRFPGAEQKTGRQITFSTDLIYDVLRRHQPDHLLLRCARADAATGLIDVARLGDMLARIKGRIRHAALDHLSPFSVPILIGVLPLVSGRHAEFLHNEVPGISIPEPIRARLRRAGEGAWREGLGLAEDLMDQVRAAGAAGVYVMPQFGRFDQAAEVVEAARRI